MIVRTEEFFWPHDYKPEYDPTLCVDVEVELDNGEFEARKYIVGSDTVYKEYTYFPFLDLEKEMADKLSRWVEDQQIKSGE